VVWRLRGPALAGSAEHARVAIPSRLSRLMRGGCIRRPGEKHMLAAGKQRRRPVARQSNDIQSLRWPSPGADTVRMIAKA
jgi:hypothetical protein